MSFKRTLTRLSRVKPYIEIATAVALVYFAYSTDQVYHRLADIAGSQTQIIDAQNRAVFGARVETTIDRNDSNSVVEKLIISNTGAAVSQLGVSISSIMIMRTRKSLGRTDSRITFDPAGEEIDCRQQFDHAKPLFLDNYFSRGRYNAGTDVYATAETKMFGLVSRLVELVNVRKFGLHDNTALVLQPDGSFRHVPKVQFDIIHLIGIRFVDRLGRAGDKQFFVTRDGSYDPTVSVTVREASSDEFHKFANSFHLMNFAPGEESRTISITRQVEQSDLFERLANEMAKWPMTPDIQDAGSNCDE